MSVFHFPNLIGRPASRSVHKHCAPDFAPPPPSHNFITQSTTPDFIKMISDETSVLGLRLTAYLQSFRSFSTQLISDGKKKNFNGAAVGKQVDWSQIWTRASYVKTRALQGICLTYRTTQLSSSQRWIPSRWLSIVVCTTKRLTRPQKEFSNIISNKLFFLFA